MWEPFEQRFRCTILWNQEKNQMVLDRADFGRPLPRAHPALSQVHDEMVIRYLAELDKNDVVSLVRTALVDLMVETRVALKQQLLYE